MARDKRVEMREGDDRRRREKMTSSYKEAIKGGEK